MRKMLFGIIFLIFSIVVEAIIIFVGGFLLNTLGVCAIYALAPAFVVATFLTLFYCEEDTLEDLNGCCYIGAGIIGLVIILVIIDAGLALTPAVVVAVVLFIFAFLVEETRDL